MTSLPENFYRKCIEHHKQLNVQRSDLVVGDSIPIPYFGDVGAFLKSDLKVVTAALNPSDREFEKKRFNVPISGAEELERELSSYFKIKPYEWFKNFQPVLMGMDAGYGGTFGSAKNTALHLDMCSPIATRKKWSSLASLDKDCLTPVGKEIFDELIDLLKPHVVVMSLAWSHIEHWSERFSSGRAWPSLLSYDVKLDGSPRKHGSIKLQFDWSDKILWVNGSAQVTPFTEFGDRRREAGSAIFREIERSRSL